MSWYNPFSWFGASEKAVDTAADLVSDISSGIDKMFYTEEEKADAKAKAYGMWLEILRLEKDAAGPRAVTRRIIACVIVGQWALMLNVGLIFLLFNMTEQAKVVFGLMPAVTGGVTVIIGFYFGPNMIARAIRDNKKD